MIEESMNEYGRNLDILRPVSEDLYHFAPVPLIYRDIEVEDLAALNRQLLEVARSQLTPQQLEVPDRRQIDSLGRAPEVRDEAWSETQVTAVGIWHRVPTNNLLDVPAGSVKILRSIIEERYLFAVAATGELAPGEKVSPWVTESWIQFYQDGDDKVLHNHERYGPPYPEHRWSGAYYIADGTPDETMPYSGMFSFRVRGANYFVRPRPGLLMLWPADILHEVHPFYGKDQRVVINFNINGRPERSDD
jgi:Putative 2OG-Fe(II) oxygenase